MTFAQRSRRLALASGLLLVTMALAAPVLAATVAVSIADKSFTPTDIVVAQGDTVTWTVTKAIADPHSVTSGVPGAADAGKLFDSGVSLQKEGESYSFTFTAAGSYEYFCKVHSTEMKGKVVVLAEGATPGEAEAGIPMERRLIGAGILVVTLIVLFGAAMVWRRMNPA